MLTTQICTPRITGALLVFIFLLSSGNQSQAGWTIQGSAAPTTPNQQIMLEGLSDGTILEGYPDATCGGHSELLSGYDDYLYPNGRVVRSLLRFDLSAIPAGATITQATLQMYFYSSWDVPNITRNITTTRSTTPWAEGSLGWANAPVLDGNYGTVQLTQVNAPTWVSWDITTLVSGWQQGSFSNYGLALRGPEHSGTDSSWKSFASSETQYGPRLWVSYSLPDQASTPSGSSARHPIRLDTTGDSFTLYLPVIQQQLLADPDLHPIDNNGGKRNYTINWTPYSKAPALHELQEWIGNSFQTIFTDVADTHTYFVSGKAPGTYRYRLLASSQWGVAYSQERQVTVSEKPLEMAYLTVGIANYPVMLPAPTTYPDARLGFDLLYPLFDSAEAWENLLVLGKSYMDESIEHVLSLNESRATKSAFKEAITGWIKAHEDSRTTTVIYFSGHSLQGLDLPPLDEPDGLDEYLAPYDLTCSPCSNPINWALETAIRDDELVGWLGELTSQRIALIIDSTFGYGFVDDLKSPGKLVLASNQANEVRWEFGGLKNGAFTAFLFQALADQSNDHDQNGWIAIQEVFSSVANQVNQYVYMQSLNIFGGPYYQHPLLYDNIPGALDLTQPPVTSTCPLEP